MRAFWCLLLLGLSVNAAINPQQSLLFGLAKHLSLSEIGASESTSANAQTKTDSLRRSAASTITQQKSITTVPSTLSTVTSNNKLPVHSKTAQSSQGLSEHTAQSGGNVTDCKAAAWRTASISSKVHDYSSGDLACTGGPKFSNNKSSNFTGNNSAAMIDKGISKYPAKGCKPHNSTLGHCICENGASQVGTVGVSSNMVPITVCGTNAHMPPGYVALPTSKKSPTGLTISTPPAWMQEPPEECASGQYLNSTCWDTLDMTEYVQWWWSSFKPACQEKGVGFSECFLTNVGYSGSACQTLQDNPVCPLPMWCDFDSSTAYGCNSGATVVKWNAVRNYYLAYNIYMLTHFFTNYYTALGKASDTAASHIASIVEVLKPPSTDSVALDAILQAMSVGISLMPGPEGGAVTNAIMSGLEQVPGQLSTYLFPGGSATSPASLWDPLLQTSDLQTQMTTVTLNLQSNITKALLEIQTDGKNFAAFANDGVFCSNTTVNLASATLDSSILIGFDTYMMSQAIQANNLILTRQLNTDVNQLQTNGTALNWATGCGNGYGKYGECSAFWYDQTSQTSYALADGSNLQHDFSSVLEQLFAIGSSGEQLFRGADLCAQSVGKNQGGGPVMTFDNSSFSSSCMSNLMVCTWSLTPTDVNTQVIPFTDCDGGTVLQQFGKVPCTTQLPSECTEGAVCAPSGGSTGTTVPLSYLGWGILNNAAYQSWSGGLNGGQMCVDN